MFWVREPAYLITCVLVSCAAFFLTHIPRSRFKLHLWFDAVAMGVVTATFGSIVRNVLGGESPVILSHEIYVSAALCRAAIFVALAWALVSREHALAGGFLA